MGRVVRTCALVLVASTCMLIRPSGAAPGNAKVATTTAKVAAGNAPRTVNQILADYSKAIGGTGPWRKVKTARLTFNVTVKGMGISGQGERLQRSDGSFYERLIIPGIGNPERGSDGKKLWARDLINGLRVLEGAEREQAVLDTAWMADLRLKQLYKKIKAAQSSSPGEDCLELSAKAGPPVTRCFDGQTSLLKTQSGVQVGPQGESPYKAVFSDYRDVSGALLPYLQEVSVGPVTLILAIDEVELNATVDAALFRLPKP